MFCFNFPPDKLQQRAVQELSPRVGGGGAAEDHGLVGGDGHQAALHAAAARVKEHHKPRALRLWQVSLGLPVGEGQSRGVGHQVNLGQPGDLGGVQHGESLCLREVLRHGEHAGVHLLALVSPHDLPHLGQQHAQHLLPHEGFFVDLVTKLSIFKLHNLSSNSSMLILNKRIFERSPKKVLEIAH